MTVVTMRFRHPSRVFQLKSRSNTHGTQPPAMGSARVSPCEPWRVGSIARDWLAERLTSCGSNWQRNTPEHENVPVSGHVSDLSGGAAQGTDPAQSPCRSA